MKKHTLQEVIVSFVIGATLSIPITIIAINNPTQPTTIKHVVRHEIVTIEDNKIPTIAKTSKKTSDKKSLGKFKITAYCPCSKCCGKSDGITASGTKVKEGRTIAVDPKVIPLGSKVEIDGKTYIAEDVGGGVKGNIIDLYFDSHEEALKFGVKYKNVYIKEN